MNTALFRFLLQLSTTAFQELQVQYMLKFANLASRNRASMAAQPTIAHLLAHRLEQQDLTKSIYQQLQEVQYQATLQAQNQKLSFYKMDIKFYKN